MLSSKAARVRLARRTWLLVKPIICTAKVAAEARAVKGLSRHKRTGLLRTWPFIPRSLDSPVFSRFLVLNS